MKPYLKPESIIPANDKARVEKLHNYHILDTAAEESFDKIARLAADIFETPAAFVSFVDENRVFFKSNLSSLGTNVVEREESLCSLAILNEQTTQFQDTRLIKGLENSRYVAGEGGIRFYAGAPLRTLDGFNLGTVCVIDTVPRLATEKQLKMLESLSSIVVDMLEARLRARRAINAQQEFMNMVVHDLKNPVSSILLASETILLELSDQNAVKEMAEFVKSGAHTVSKKLEELLQQNHFEQADFQIRRQSLDICSLLDQVISNFRLQLQQKAQKVKTMYSAPVDVRVDPKRMQEVFENLLSNAIKYSEGNTTIGIDVLETDNSVIISFADQGLGMSKEDLSKLFTRYASLSARPTGKESSHGLGLWIARILVELHKGTIEGLSEGIGKGSTFRVSIPK